MIYHAITFYVLSVLYNYFSLSMFYFVTFYNRDTRSIKEISRYNLLVSIMVIIIYCLVYASLNSLSIFHYFNFLQLRFADNFVSWPHKRSSIFSYKLNTGFSIQEKKLQEQ